MHLALRVATVLAIVLLIVPPALAVITFSQLDDDIFVISHRVKGLGLRGKAMKLVYEKAASVCVAAGYSHFKILEQESNTGQQYESANASIRAQFFLTDGEGRIDCQRNSSAEYVEQARAKLVKMGYRPPETVAMAADVGEGSGDLADPTCTVEQIAAMVKLGLTPEQIKAACPDQR